MLIISLCITNNLLDEALEDGVLVVETISLSSLKAPSGASKLLSPVVISPSFFDLRLGLVVAGGRIGRSSCSSSSSTLPSCLLCILRPTGLFFSEVIVFSVSLSSSWPTTSKSASLLFEVAN